MATLNDRRRVLQAAVDLDSEPLTESFPNNHHEQPRRVAGRRSHRPRLSRQRSFTDNIGRVASETYLVTRMTFTLLQYLGYVYF